MDDELIVTPSLQLHDDCSHHTADALDELDTQAYAQSSASQGQCGRCDLHVHRHLHTGSLFTHPALRAHRH